MKKLLTLIQFFLFFHPSSGQVSGKLYSDTAYLRVAYINSGFTPDSTIIWSGISFDSTLQDASRFIVRLDADGEYLSGVYTDSLQTYGFCNTENNGYLFSSVYGVYPNDRRCLLKMDQLFNVEWVKKISKNACISGTEYPSDLFQIGQNFFACNNHRYCNQNSFPEIIKLNNQGSIVSQVAYGDTMSDHSFDPHFLISPDSELVILGPTFRQSIPENYLTVMKIDTALNFLWCKKLQVNGYGYMDLFDANMLSDGSMLLSGKYNVAFSANQPYYFIARISANGTVLFSKTIYTNPVKAIYHYSFQLSDQEYVFTGYFKDTLSTSRTPIIIKYDSSGNFISSQSFNYPGFDNHFVNPVSSDNNSLLSFFGDNRTTQSLNTFFIKSDYSFSNMCFAKPFDLFDSSLVLIDSSLQFYPIPTNYSLSDTTFQFYPYQPMLEDLCEWLTVNNQEEDFSIQSFPNPTKGKLTIRNGQNSISSIEIYNVLGVQVKSLHIGIGQKEIQIDLTNLPPGIYFVQATTAEKLFRGKVIKE
ncbi:hypothetical protein BH11BAC1_BH11BAC1_03250 [soil metagenome]